MKKAGCQGAFITILQLVREFSLQDFSLERIHSTRYDMRLSADLRLACLFATKLELDGLVQEEFLKKNISWEGKVKKVAYSIVRRQKLRLVA